MRRQTANRLALVASLLALVSCIDRVEQALSPDGFFVNKSPATYSQATALPAQNNSHTLNLAYDSSNINVPVPSLAPHTQASLAEILALANQAAADKALAQAKAEAAADGARKPFKFSQIFQRERTAQLTTVQAAPVPTGPQLRLPARIRLAGEQPDFNVRRCINLGNALEAPREGEWGYEIQAEDMGAIKDAGFDTVRIPIRWDNHMQSQPPYRVLPYHMIRVKEVVNQARSLGLNVIIDVHHYEALIENPRREEARFLALWEQIAQEFSGAPKNVYFEVLNEPTNAISMGEVNRLYSKVIPLIRRTNPERTLIIGGNHWNSVDTLDDIAWPNDKNIVATFHDYGPHEFTHQGAPWTDNPYPKGRRWGSAADLAELEQTYQLAQSFQVKRNVPIFVGEFGVIDQVPADQRANWIKARRKFMEAAGFSWCAWDLAGAFSSYDTVTREWLPGFEDAYFGP